MNALGFDHLARQCGGVSRRRALGLLGGALAGGLIAATGRQGSGLRAQESVPVGSPVPVPPAPPAACSYYILSGGPDVAAPLHVDDDLVVFINGVPIFEEHDNVPNIMPPIAFQAVPGDILTVVARDAVACGRKISALWLHCADGGDPRFLSGGRDDGCDPERPVHENFFRERWLI